MTFFRQHNVDSSDAQIKYKSRAAQLYRDKLHHLATQAMRLHGTKVNSQKGFYFLSNSASETSNLKIKQFPKTEQARQFESTNLYIISLVIC